MPAPLISKDEVLLRVTDAFRRVGFEGATLALLAKETGLKKASLYHYFPGGKKEMAEAALGQVSLWLRDEIFGVLEGQGTPEARLKKMVKNVNRFHQSGRKWCLVDLFSLGEAGRLFGPTLAEALKTWIKLLEELAVEGGVPSELARVRAEETLIAIQGSLVLSRAQGNPKLFKRVISELPKRLLGTQ